MKVMNFTVVVVFELEVALRFMKVGVLIWLSGHLRIFSERIYDSVSVGKIQITWSSARKNKVIVLSEYFLGLNLIKSDKT